MEGAVGLYYKFFGPVSGPTGYDEIVRNTLKQFIKNGDTIALENFLHWSPVRVKLDEETHLLIQHSLNMVVPAGQRLVKFHFCLPQQMQLNADEINLNCTMFEADKIIHDWMMMSMKADRTILPGKFCRDTWIDSGALPEKLRIVPLGVDTELYNEDVPPLELVDTETGKSVIEQFPIRILIVQEVSKRKNLTGALRAVYKAIDQLGIRDKVCIILKASSYTRVTDLGRMIFMQKRALKLEGSLKGDEKDYHLYLYPQILPISAMPQFFALGTHYLSMSYGEGCDMNALQAGAMKRPIIVPDHTGYVEYANQNTAWTIPTAYKAPAQQDGAVQKLYENAQWFVPDDAQAIEVIKEALSDKNESQTRAEKLQKFIQENRTWKHFSDGLKAVAGEFL